MSIPLQSASLYDGQEVFLRSDCLLDLGTDFLVRNIVLYQMSTILRYQLISMARIPFCSSAVRVHDLQTYRKMYVTRGRISCILELFQTGLNTDLSMLLSSVLSWRGSQALNPRQIQLNPDV